jgi:hypothetical protein
MIKSVRFRGTVSRRFGVYAAAAILVAVLLAWLLALYPPLALCIIVGTGRHWVHDAIVGTLIVAVGSVAAWWLHPSRAPPPLPPPEPPARAIALAVGYALAADFADALSSTRVSLTHPSPASIGIPLLIVLAALIARRR